MGPNAFWNVDFGQRDKVDAFVEWERRWGTRWTSRLGIRSTTVDSNAAQVQGYDNGLVGLLGQWSAFNALERKRTDRNWGPYCPHPFGRESDAGFRVGIRAQITHPQFVPALSMVHPSHGRVDE